MRLLDHILENTEMDQAIIFISTRNAAENLADELQEKGYVTDALHGNMSQRQRTRTIAKLRRGATNILVATDVAARGIDVRTLSHVINIDLPFQAEDYIHRIGRTGRAGEKGVAITFATYKEEKAVASINKMMGTPMTTHTIAGFEPSPKGKGPKSSERRKGPRKFSKNFKNKKKGSSFSRNGNEMQDASFFPKSKKKKGSSFSRKGNKKQEPSFFPKRGKKKRLAKAK